MCVNKMRFSFILSINFQKFSIVNSKYSRPNHRPPMHLIMKEIKFLGTVHVMVQNWLTVSEPLQSLVVINSVAWVQNDAFKSHHFENLKDLTFQMRIQYFHDGAFNGLGNLKTLTVKETGILTFPPRILTPLRSLEEFTMEKCIKRDLSVNNLFGMANLPNVRKVDISNCVLATTITEHTFTGLKNVTDLILAGNQINRIGQRSFDAILPSLENLNLMKNDLRRLPKFIFAKALQSQVKINLQQNYWHCNCDLDDLRQFVQLAPQHFEGSKIMCLTPKIYLHRQLHVLPSLCSNNTTSTKQHAPISTPTEKDKMNVNKISQHTAISIPIEKEKINFNKIPHEVALQGAETMEIHNSIVNLTVFVQIPKPVANNSVIHLFFAVQMIYLLFFHFLMFLFEI